MKNKQARQGDIFFEEVSEDKVPREGKPLNSLTLAYGEATGHTHAIVSPTKLSDLDSVVDEEGNIYVKSAEKILVDHDEHGAVTLEPDTWYCISGQREYDPLAIERERRVAD